MRMAGANPDEILNLHCRLDRSERSLNRPKRVILAQMDQIVAWIEANEGAAVELVVSEFGGSSLRGRHQVGDETIEPLTVQRHEDLLIANGVFGMPAARFQCGQSAGEPRHHPIERRLE